MNPWPDGRRRGPSRSIVPWTGRQPVRRFGCMVLTASKYAADREAKKVAEKV